MSLLFLLQTVPITLYYEALCPDSIKFFTEQLTPTYRDLNRDVNLDLQLIPFGKSQIHQQPDNRVTMECRHGPNECYGQKIQACAIENLKGNQQRLIEFVDCLMMSSKDKNLPYPTKKCANQFSVDVNILEQCANGTEVDKLLLENERLTNMLKPALSSVPTIVFKNQFMKDDNDKAQNNFKGILCKYIDSPKPKACEGVNGAPFAAISGTTVVVATFMTFILAH